MANGFQIALGLVAGLALFLYGVNLLSDELRRQGGERVRSALERFTQSRLAGVFTGAVTTTLIDSSSVTIIRVISLVNAGLLTFEHSLPVIMGANIGTTISSQIFAFDLDSYSPALLGIGLIAQVLGPGDRLRNIGRIIFAFGLVFFGLHYIGKSMAPLKEYGPFLDWLKRVESPIYGAAVGALFTGIVQSSSATMGIVITMATEGMVSLPAGIALMLGAEVGTCADTLMASIGRSRAALRAGIFQLFFNVTTVALGVVLIGQLTQLAGWVSMGGGVARQIANAHVMFNVAGVLLMIGPLRQIRGLMMHIIPEERHPSASRQGAVAQPG